MGANDHFMCTDVEWDPTGRYVFTAVSWWGHKIDNGFWLWNFQGRVLNRHNVQRMCNVQWRPRPKTLLSERQIKNIKKSLTKYGAQFDLKDKMRASRASRVRTPPRVGVLALESVLRHVRPLAGRAGLGDWSYDAASRRVDVLL